MIRQVKILALTSLFLLSLFVLFGTEAQAAIINPVIGDLGTNEGAADGSKFINYTVYLWRTSINIGALVVIVFFIWGAFEWLTAGSDTKKTETARTRITNAIVGLVIMVASFTILSFVSKLFFGENFDLLKLTFPGINEAAPAAPKPGGAGGPGGGLPGGGYNYY